MFTQELTRARRHCRGLIGNVLMCEQSCARRAIKRLSTGACGHLKDTELPGSLTRVSRKPCCGAESLGRARARALLRRRSGLRLRGICIPSGDILNTALLLGGAGAGNTQYSTQPNVFWTFFNHNKSVPTSHLIQVRLVPNASHRRIYAPAMRFPIYASKYCS